MGHKVKSSPEAVSAGQAFASKLTFQAPTRAAAPKREPRRCYFGGCKRTFHDHGLGPVLHTQCGAAAATWTAYRAAIKAGERDAFEAEVAALAGIERK